MSNIDAVNALLTAINFARFAEIEARHAPDVTFTSFRGPTLQDNVSVADWYREFLRDYADCNYTDIEYIEEGDTVAVRATIEAKGYDWRLFTQRVVDVFRFEDGEIVERRLYGMLRDIEFDKATQAAMDDALGYRGGSPAASRKTFEDLLAAFAAGDMEKAQSYFHEKFVLVDGVYGLAHGFDEDIALANARPRPAFGVWRVTRVLAGDHALLLEAGFDPARPRQAEWIRLVDGKSRVAEVYWMLREIGVRPDENYARDRHQRQVILPI
jgi:ketosteroid isomerase-like protein